MRPRGRAFLPAAATMLLLLFARNTTFAGSATWKTSPSSGDWNTAANWTPATVPNGPSDTATFSSSNTTNVSLSANTEVNGIVFDVGAPSFFRITASPTFALTISGVGITNNSGVGHVFETAVDGAAHFGVISFTNSATAGNLTAFTAGGGTVNGAAGGRIVFHNNSTAGDATLGASGGSNGGMGAVIQFFNKSDGGTAIVGTSGTGKLDIHNHDAPGVAIGCLQEDGIVLLGANRLTVGTNGLSRFFDGLIKDGSGGPGGSLRKVGRGLLALTKANSYTGGTMIDGGTLRVENTSGSGTGGGAVQVNGGTLGGIGTIAGTVTVGNGSGRDAILAPGRSGMKIFRVGSLTIQSAITFDSDAIYEFELNRNITKADEVIANNVTIGIGAQFSFINLGSGTVTLGTVFTVINNTAATPIMGTFSNLADGATFTSNGNTFEVDYQGGTGNDLTLTVVP